MVILAAVTELCFRFIYPNNFGRLEFSKEYGYYHTPNYTARFRSKEFSTQFTYNSYGMKDKEYSIAKPGGIYRIAFFGDSMIEAEQVNYEKNFIYLFQEQIDSIKEKKSYNTEMMNFGCGGYSTALSYLLYTYLGKRFSPDVVVLCFFPGNDISDNSIELASKSMGFDLKYPPRPFYKINDSGGLEPLPFVDYSDYLSLPFKLGVKNFLYNNSAFYRFIRSQIHSSFGIYNLMMKIGISSKREIKKRKDIIPVNYAVFYPGEYTKEWQEAWDITEKIIHKFNSDCIKENIKFVLVNIPTSEMVNSSYYRMTLEKYPIMGKYNIDIDYPSKRLQGFCDNNHIPFIDLTGDIRGLKTGDKSLYFKDDRHLSAQGHKIVADILFNKYIEYFDVSFMKNINEGSD